MMKTLSLVVAFAVCVGWAAVASAQSCHLRELDLCSATLVVLTQNPNGLAQTDDDIDRQCVYLKEAETCFGNFSRRCQTRDQREFGRAISSDNSFSLIRDYCRPGSDLRTRYLQNAACLNLAYKEQRSCVKDLQASLESLNDIDWNQRLTYGCCSYRRFSSCMEDLVVSKCGPESREYGNFLLRMAVSRFPDVVCHKGYSHKRPKCRRILPPPGTEPRGARSPSVIGRLFSAYTGV